MALNLKPHKMAIDKGSRTERCVKRDPYIRVAKAEEYKNANGKICYRKTPALFLQGGQYYTEDGASVVEVPEWAQAEIAKISDRAMAEAGFLLGSANLHLSTEAARPKRKYQRKPKLMAEVHP